MLTETRNKAIGSNGVIENAFFGGAMLAPIDVEDGFVGTVALPDVEPAQGIEEKYKGFQVTDLKSAEWAASKVARWVARKKQIDDFVKGEIEEYTAKMKAYQADMDAECDDHINFLTEKLRPFAEQQVEGTKKKSFKLPSGTLQFKTEYDVTKDEKKLLEYVKTSAPEYLKVEESVKWGELKNQLQWTEEGKAVTPDGEVLDCVSRAERQTFKVKF